MYWNVIEIKTEDNFTLWVRFADGISGHVRFSSDFFTGVFESLKDINFFRKAFISNGAVSWPGDIDLAPDSMYHEIKRNGEWALTA